MPTIQIANNQNSLLQILLIRARIVYILVKFTVNIVHIDSNLNYYFRAKIVQIYEIS
jgi:hypothetical protein